MAGTPTPFALLLLTDGRFPSGGYAHSGGLEDSVMQGLSVDGLPLFVEGRLRYVSGPEAMLAVAAARASRNDDRAALAQLDAEADARCPSPALRLASRRLGSQLLRTARAVWPGAAGLESYAGASATTPRPVVFGVVAAAVEVDDHQTALAYLYDDVMTNATAAVRLLPVDTSTTMRALVDFAPLVEELAASAVSAPLDGSELPGSFAPALDIGSMRHAARDGRLFAS